MMQEIADAEEKEAREASKQKRQSGSQKSHSGVSDMTMEDLTTIDDDDFDQFSKYNELVS